MRLLVVLLFVSMPLTAQSTWREKVSAFQAAKMQHTAWGVSHGERDYRLALEVAKREGLTVDDDALWAAAMLHDIAAFEPWAKAGVDHGDRAAEVLPDSLKAWGFPVAKIAIVQDAVSHHMYYHAVGATNEARALRDADSIDFLGLEGVIRILSVATRNRVATDLPTALKTLRTTADEMPAKLSTNAGKAMAVPRVAAMRVFFDGLDAELKGIGAP